MNSDYELSSLEGAVPGIVVNTEDHRLLCMANWKGSLSRLMRGVIFHCQHVSGCVIYFILLFLLIFATIIFTAIDINIITTILSTHIVPNSVPGNLHAFRSIFTYFENNQDIVRYYAQLMDKEMEGHLHSQ